MNNVDLESLAQFNLLAKSKPNAMFTYSSLRSVTWQAWIYIVFCILLLI